MPRVTFQVVRDSALLTVGLGLIGEETLLQPEPRAILIGLAAAMIGLPATWLADRKFLNPITPSAPPPPVEAGKVEQDKP